MRFASGASQTDTVLPKQFVPICGIPMIVYSLKAFDACEAVNEIIIVTRKEDIAYTEKIIRDFQRINGIAETGRVGRETWDALAVQHNLFLTRGE